MHTSRFFVCLMRQKKIRGITSIRMSWSVPGLEDSYACAFGRMETRGLLSSLEVLVSLPPC